MASTDEYKRVYLRLPAAAYDEMLEWARQCKMRYPDFMRVAMSIGAWRLYSEMRPEAAVPPDLLERVVEVLETRASQGGGERR